MSLDEGVEAAVEGVHFAALLARLLSARDTAEPRRVLVGVSPGSGLDALPPRRRLGFAPPSSKSLGGLSLIYLSLKIKK